MRNMWLQDCTFLTLKHISSFFRILSHFYLPMAQTLDLRFKYLDLTWDLRFKHLADTIALRFIHLAHIWMTQTLCSYMVVEIHEIFPMYMGHNAQTFAIWEKREA